MKSDIEQIIIRRQEADFDRACDSAAEQAVYLFGIDDCGHPKDERFQRSRCCLKVEFKSYERTMGMGGGSSTYKFVAYLEQDDEDEDDEENKGVSS